MLHTCHFLTASAFLQLPGEKEQYASPGYELLGLALVHIHKLERWEGFDQLSVLDRGALRAEFNGTAFPGRGKCSNDPLIVHQYANSP